MRDSNYGVSAEKASAKAEAPNLAFGPPVPRDKSLPIAMIGMGGISEFHLKAYARMDLNVVALCDRNEGRAQEKRDKFFPQAAIYSDYREMLDRDDVKVLDIATHPGGRNLLVEAALRSGRHVLSQKPFVLDLDEGRRLVRLAEEQGVQLAVNQNGRWAPHFRYMTRAIEGGHVGRVNTIDICMQWDQTWVAGNEGFESIHHMVLFDFAIHWFDIVTRMMDGREPEAVFASVRKFPGQDFRPPALAHAVIDYSDAQVRLLFNAHNRFGEEDSTTITGDLGLMRSRGPRLTDQQVTLYTSLGEASPELRGDWFNQGFEGTMGELLCAVEEGREPENSARNNLKSLELTFAALRSADTGQPIRPGSVRRVVD